ncbi:MAG: HesA/MoeB/ThiF family protein [Desulfuromonadales bacterium]
MEALRTYLREQAVDDLVAWPFQVTAAERFSLSVAEVEAAILSSNLLPARYQRNRKMLTLEQQTQLFRSRVAVIGCGGLGGYVLEELARLGVGHLVAVDPDVFEEHNLNRQLLATPQALGAVKVEAAVRRVAEINPAVTVRPVQELISRANGAVLLAGVDCVVDAVDNVTTRLDLEVICRELNLPLVHGAIAGWYGHVTTVLPGDETLSRLYRHWTGGKGIEQQLGNPSFTPAMIASLEVAETCKVLLGQGALLRNRKLSFNLLDMEVEEVPL